MTESKKNPADRDEEFVAADADNAPKGQGKGETSSARKVKDGDNAE